jgi:hypothetical protein
MLQYRICLSFICPSIFNDYEMSIMGCVQRVRAFCCADIL